MKKGASFYYFKRKPIVLSSKYERWREVEDILKLKANNISNIIF